MIHDEEYHSASRKLPLVDEVHQAKLDEEEAEDSRQEIYFSNPNNLGGNV